MKTGRRTVVLSICILIVVFLTGCDITYKGTILLDKENISAKNICKFLTEEFEEKKEWRGYRKLRAGEIRINIDESSHETIEIIFMELLKSNPAVIVATIDNFKEPIASINEIGRDSKLWPGLININDWRIDSDDALRIGKAYVLKENFSFDEVLIHGNSSGFLEGDQWSLRFWDNKTKTSCYIRIDPYDGEIIGASIFDNNFEE